MPKKNQIVKKDDSWPGQVSRDALAEQWFRRLRAPRKEFVWFEVAPTMTSEQMVDDAEEIVRYLQRTYGKKKIILLGHYWGTVLGVTLAQRHPEWFYAYVGVGQLIDAQRNELEGYHFALAQARLNHNVAAVQELESIAPYPGNPGSLTVTDTISASRLIVSQKGLDGLMSLQINCLLSRHD